MVTIRKNQFSIYFLLILLVLVWALSWPIAKIALLNMDPLWFAEFRMLIGCVAMFIFVLLQGKLTKPNRQDYKLIMGIGILQMGIFIIAISLGLKYVAAGRSAMLVYTTPLWVTPLAVCFFGEKLNFLKSVGLILGIMGLATLFQPNSFNWHNPHVLYGNFFLLLAALSWSIAILLTRYSVWHKTPLELISWQLLIAVVLILPCALIFEPHPNIHWNMSLIMALLYNGLFATAFGYWGAITISKSLPAINSSLAFLLIPVFGLFCSNLILNEQISVTMMLAMCAIISGLACMIMSQKPLVKS